MTWLLIDKRRVNSDQIVRYQPTMGFDGDSRPMKFQTEVELTNGKSFFTNLTMEQIDELLGLGR